MRPLLAFLLWPISFFVGVTRLYLPTLGIVGLLCHQEPVKFISSSHLLAHAFPPGDSPLAGDVHFDAEERWTYGVNTSSPEARSTGTGALPRDLLLATMHEVGHSLGLQHSQETNDIMYPVYDKYVSHPHLNEGDIRQLQTLYGSNPRYRRSAWYLRRRKQLMMRRMRRRKKWRFRLSRNMPRWCRMVFNDVIMVSRGAGYIFSGLYVYKFSNKGVLPGYPLHIHQAFPGAPINPAAVVYVRITQKIYFFKDDRLWRFTNQTLDPGYPSTPRRRFPERPSAGLSMVDHRGKNMVYIFGEKLIWRWNPFSEESNGRYHFIKSHWKGIPKKLDAVVQWSDGYVYFFRRNKYFKANIYHKVTLSGYPKFKGSAWLGGDCGSRPK